MLYQVINEFLLSLFPNPISDFCLAWVDLASIVSMSLIYVVFVLFIISCFKFVYGLFKF